MAYGNVAAIGAWVWIASEQNNHGGELHCWISLGNRLFLPRWLSPRCARVNGEKGALYRGKVVYWHLHCWCACFSLAQHAVTLPLLLQVNPWCVGLHPFQPTSQWAADKAPLDTGLRRMAQCLMMFACTLTTAAGAGCTWIGSSPCKKLVTAAFVICSSEGGLFTLLQAGLTIDMGPFCFLDTFDPYATPNMTDLLEGKRYGKEDAVV